MTFKKATFLFCFFLLLLTCSLSFFPGHNGDLPFYVACVIEKEQGSMDGVVEKTRQALQRELPPAEYADHAARITGTDAAILERYRIKPLYIWLVLAFHQMGFSYVRASVLVSLLAYFLIGLSIWRMLLKKLAPVKALLVSICCLLIYPTLVLARLSSPDALSCLFFLNALFLIYNGQRKTVWSILFMLAICTRLDNLVPELILLTALWKWPTAGFPNKLKTGQFICLSLMLLALAFLVNLLATHHFLWFRDPHFSEPSGQYLRDVRLVFYVLPGSFFLYLAVFFIFSGFARGFSWKQEPNAWCYTVCAMVIVRLLLYPFYEERYLAPYLLFSLLTLYLYYYAGLNNRPEKEGLEKL